MKLKVPLIIISLIILIFLILTFSNLVPGSDFIDNGTSSNNNDHWINNQLNVTRNNQFTTLSGKSNTSLWYMADHTLYGDFTVEWDNHGNDTNSDYCIISDKNKTTATPLSFHKLEIKKGSHVKLVIQNNTITPYINNVSKTPEPLNIDPKKGMVFRFQINQNGSDICYSNFKIHSI